MLEHSDDFTDPSANPSVERDGDTAPTKRRLARWVVPAFPLLLIAFLLPSPWRSSQGESDPSSQVHSPSAADSDQAASAEPATLQSASLDRSAGLGGDADKPDAVIAAAAVAPGNAGTPAAVEYGSLIPSHAVVLASSALDLAELLATGVGNAWFHAVESVAPTTADMSTGTWRGFPSPLQLAAGLGSSFPLTPLASASASGGTVQATGPAATGSQDSTPTGLVDARSPAGTPPDESGPANARAAQSPDRNAAVPDHVRAGPDRNGAVPDRNAAVPAATSAPRANGSPVASPEPRVPDEVLLSDASSGDPDLNGPRLLEPGNMPVAAEEPRVTAAAVPLPGTGLLMLLAGILLLCVRRGCVSHQS